MRFRSESGTGSVMALAGVLIALAIWGIFSLVMAGIEKSQKAKRESVKEFFESRKPKVKKKVRREVKGYTLKY